MVNAWLDSQVAACLTVAGFWGKVDGTKQQPAIQVASICKVQSAVAFCFWLQRCFQGKARLVTQKPPAFGLAHSRDRTHRRIGSARTVSQGIRTWHEKVKDNHPIFLVLSRECVGMNTLETTRWMVSRRGIPCPIPCESRRSQGEASPGLNPRDALVSL